jgi:nucleoside-diphosphate-sugar epimerase
MTPRHTNNIKFAKVQSQFVRKGIMKRALITGGNGFIGSHLIEYLVAKNVKVRCIDKSQGDFRWSEGIEVEVIRGDLNDGDILKNAVSDVDVVFHLAGRTRGAMKEEFFQDNVQTTENILRAIIEFNPQLKRFVLISSQAVVGPSLDGIPRNESSELNPISYYGESKLAAERIVQAYSSRLPMTIIRPPTVFGPRDMDVLEFFRYIKMGISPILGAREKTVSMIYVSDLVRGMCLAAEHPAAVGQTYFIASDQTVTWNEISDAISELMEKKVIRIYIPGCILTFIALITETVSKIRGKYSLLTLKKVQELVQSNWVVDGSKARHDLGFVAETTLKEGLEKAFAWYKEQGLI